MYLFLKQTPAGVVVSVKVKLKSSQAGIGKFKPVDRELNWGVHSAPVDNQANAELSKTVAKFFSVPLSSVTIIQGFKSRSKSILLSNCSLETIISVLNRSV
ncbi:MAG: DUF167 domain-containing protein [Deltaproteobacteria bacterium]|jgi:uncharacterized protein (TIGR00251 family)|nr:DUF167 domain-containing protein [Deltaproteobacteria bacterium]